MSDFLKQFSGDEYQKQEDKGVSKNKNKEKETQKLIKEESKKEEESNLPVSESKVVNKENTFQTSNTHEETYVRDDDKIKKRKIKIIIGVVACVVIGFGGYFGYRKLNQISVPNFVSEKSLNDVEIWAAKNKITLDSTSEFSIQVDDGMIITQSIKGGKKIQKGANFHVLVSKGANPEEQIKLPDFKRMNLLEIEDWKSKNKASNLSVEKVFDEKLASGTFISLAFKSDGVDESNYRRKDKITITVSKGKEVFEKNIVVVDFKNKSKADVEFWADENEVTVEFSEEASKSIMEGNVISQSIPAKEKIAKNEVLGIVVSRGKIAYAPNFAGLDETQATVEATKAGVAINMVQYYSNEVASSRLISQSVASGSEVKDGDMIVLMYSLGKPYIANYDGQDSFALVEAINQMNGKGANLSYEIKEVASEQAKGIITSTSVKASFVNVGTQIVIYVSKGS